MRIKEIELDNFKSFGEKTTIPILDGFTAVSGPNGSGKSNVIDSLMFALGLTSTRTMRAEKLTDLINNLTGRPECAVKVIFVNEQTNEEVSILRKIRVKKDGYDSKYFLNDNPSTLREIHDRLARYNISPKGYNVVMQGDVASIISMNPVDRRKIIDEIAGVAEFDRKIELAGNELQIVLERIEQQETILKELQDRLDQLQHQREQALKYQELKAKRIELERQFLAVRIRQVRNEKQKTEGELEDLKTLKNNLQTEQIEINEQMSTAQAELNRLSKEIEELGAGKEKFLQGSKEELKETIAREQSTLEYLDKQINDEKQEQENIKNEIKELKRSLKNIEFKSQEFTQEIDTIRKNISEEELRYENLQQQIISKSKNSNLSTQTVIETQDRISELKSQKSKLDEQKARLDEKINMLSQDITKHRLEAESITNKIQALQTSFDTVGGVDLKEEINFTSRNIQTLKEEARDTKTEINNQELKLRKVVSELAKLEGKNIFRFTPMEHG